MDEEIIAQKDVDMGWQRDALNDGRMPFSTSVQLASVDRLIIMITTALCPTSVVAGRMDEKMIGRKGRQADQVSERASE